ncbi:hypothetical protein H1P_810028 [Hyella patelloides LEGE 07179]|uniref:Uncharacterized protein n=1 Tax=Hyella patelloides LEGE 07179 TaxID=945734 RepID=A0A563W4H9_9CYAN|nr:hypothetical protein H1P_810028 [Hyella patelloides LEGE 07179]
MDFKIDKLNNILLFFAHIKKQLIGFKLEKNTVFYTEIYFFD